MAPQQNSSHSQILSTGTCTVLLYCLCRYDKTVELFSYIPQVEFKLLRVSYAIGNGYCNWNWNPQPLRAIRNLPYK